MRSLARVFCAARARPSHGRARTMGEIRTTGKGRRWLETGHPWLYRDEIVSGEASPGELAPVVGPNGEPLGWGLVSTASRIAVRLVTRSAEQPTRAFWEQLVRRAVARRARLGLLAPEGASRLVHGDADELPGVVVDRYGEVLVYQATTQAADRMRDFLLELVGEALPFAPRAIVERADSGVRRLEHLELRKGVLSGELPEPLLVREDELVYEVDVLEGHKTGHYLDQRENRRLAARGAEGSRVLDAFSYDGLFGIRAALAGAREVVCVDQSEAAGERLLRNAERNGVAGRVRFERADAMRDLRRRSAAGERYDLVVADPPAFARNRRELAGAERGYVELARRAIELALDGGRVVLASCSHLVRTEAFVRYLRAGAARAGRHVVLEDLRGAAPDHPHRLALPESAYLDCAFLGVSSEPAP